MKEGSGVVTDTPTMTISVTEERNGFKPEVIMNRPGGPSVFKTEQEAKDVAYRFFQDLEVKLDLQVFDEFAQTTPLTLEDVFEECTRRGYSVNNLFQTEEGWQANVDRRPKDDERHRFYAWGHADDPIRAMLVALHNAYYSDGKSNNWANKKVLGGDCTPEEIEAAVQMVTGEIHVSKQLDATAAVR